MAATSTQAGAVRLSSPDKVLFPAQGLSKADLAAYYERIAGRIMPHLAERPLALLRCPDGRHRQCFFQKHAGASLSDGLRPVRAGGADDKPFIALISEQGLRSLVQLGTLELHVWGARRDRLDRPDQIVFDLDPGPQVPWDQTCEAAFLLRDRLNLLELHPFLKTTGGKGLHVVVPLLRRQSWQTLKDFARALSEELVRDEPRRYTTRLRKHGREDKIFIDYLRNGQGQTAVAPYSTRAREGAPVAAPLEWSELERGTQPDSVRVDNIGAYLQRADPWQEFATSRRTLTRSMRAAVGLE